MMKLEIIEDYIDKVYGYAVNHTYTYDEADELLQEILLGLLFWIVGRCAEQQISAGTSSCGV